MYTQKCVNFAVSRISVKLENVKNYSINKKGIKVYQEV